MCEEDKRLWEYTDLGKHGCRLKEMTVGELRDLIDKISKILGPLIEEANARTKTLQDIKRQIREADEQRLAAKALLKDAQDAMAAMHYVHNVSVDELKYKKTRMAVLQRLKDLKGALTPEQKRASLDSQECPAGAGWY